MNIADNTLIEIYGIGDLEKQRKRYRDLAGEFSGNFGKSESLQYVSVPGRTELGGNHTDHNHGKVLCASVSQDNIFAEIDMDFHVSKDRPNCPFGPVKSRDFFTVKMFCHCYIRDDKIAKLKMASWPPNAGVTDPSTRSFGPLPPIEG